MLIEMIAAFLTMIGNIYGLILDYILYIIVGVILYYVMKDDIRRYVKGTRFINKLTRKGVK